MSIVKRFITESIKKTEIDEFLQKKLERAGYGGINLSKTPLGTHVVVYAMRPGIVIGRGGETIRELAATLEQNFKLANPQISVSEIEVPELNAHVVASKVASALERGVHFRRAAFWALNQVMDAGALGVEIVISGKLRTEKFRAGYFPRCGEPALKWMRKAEMHVQLKPGIIGVRVKLMPPDAQFPDKVQILPTQSCGEERPEELIPMEMKPEVKEEAPPEEPKQDTAEAILDEPETATVTEGTGTPLEEIQEPVETVTEEAAPETETTEEEGKEAN